MKKLLCFLSVSLAASGTSALCEAASDAAPVSGGGMGIAGAFIPVIVVGIVAIFIWFKAARNMAGIAADKGYTERKWFHYCFWLGLVGILMVCAMPDKKRH